MRIFKGLENIHSVIDRHEAEWRKEQGEEPERLSPISVEEAVRRRLAAQPDAGSGRFSADRFLGGSVEPVKPAETPKHEPGESHESVTDDAPESGHVSESANIPESVNVSEIGNVPEFDSTPEAVEIIRNKDGKHSWLYNEVMKAINDASKGSGNTKIIAVFVPVVQNGKEFEDLPADEKITVSPIDETLTKIETPETDIDSIPAVVPVPDIIPENAAISEPEDTPEDLMLPEPEDTPETVTLPEPEDISESAEPSEESEDTPGLVTLSELITPPEIEAEPEPEITPEEPSSGDFDLIPEAKPEHDPELAEAFREIEEKLDEAIQEEYRTEEDTSEETVIPPETETDIPEDDVLQDGEPMQFEDLNPEKFSLPELLEDDEIFDETITEIHKPDDDEETIIIEEGDEIEIKPDPKN